MQWGERREPAEGTPELLDNAVVRDGLADHLGRLVLWRAHIMGQAQASQCIAKRGSPAFDATRFHPSAAQMPREAPSSPAEPVTAVSGNGRIFSRLYRGGWPQGEMVGPSADNSELGFGSGPPNHGLITG